MKRVLTATLGVFALAALSVTTTGGQAGAAAVSAAAHHGPESFSIMSTTDPSTGTIIATGLFTAGGTDQSSASADVITFADGTLTIDHTGTGKSHLDKLTCLLTTVGSGTYTFTAGTGAYAGIREAVPIPTTSTSSSCTARAAAARGTRTRPPSSTTWSATATHRCRSSTTGATPAGGSDVSTTCLRCGRRQELWTGCRRRRKEWALSPQALRRLDDRGDGTCERSRAVYPKPRRLRRPGRSGHRRRRLTSADPDLSSDAVARRGSRRGCPTPWRPKTDRRFCVWGMLDPWWFWCRDRSGWPG